MKVLGLLLLVCALSLCTPGNAHPLVGTEDIGFKSSSDVPSEFLDSGVEGAVAEPADLSPTSERERYTAVGDLDRRAAVVAIGGSGDPADIPGFVVALVVDPVHLATLDYQGLNIRDEGFYIEPSLTDANAPGAVILVALVGRIRAATDHVPPRVVERMLTETMGGADFPLVTATAHSPSAAQRVKSHNDRITATGTLAYGLVAVGPRWLTDAEDAEAPEDVPFAGDGGRAGLQAEIAEIDHDDAGLPDKVCASYGLANSQVSTTALLIG